MSTASHARAGEPLPEAAAAFDAVAADFDRRFGPWLSVQAQRAAVRRELLAAFPADAQVLELGGGTGEDAAWLSARGRRVTLTDASPAMVAEARSKLGALPCASAEVCAAEALEVWAADREAGGEPPFEGAFSNFAALNCVPDLAQVARGLARLLRPGAPALLVLFGPYPPGEVLVQLCRGRLGQALRRLHRGDVAARLGGRSFVVRYHRRRDVQSAFAPWFRLRRTRGIGVFVPPSDAEPWISRHPRLLRALEALDRVASSPLSPLGDHLLYHLERTGVPAPGGAS